MRSPCKYIVDLRANKNDLRLRLHLCVLRFYCDIQMMPPVSDQELSSAMQQLSISQIGHFHTISALKELYIYVSKYNDEVISFKPNFFLEPSIVSWKNGRFPHDSSLDQSFEHWQWTRINIQTGLVHINPQHWSWNQWREKYVAICGNLCALKVGNSNQNATNTRSWIRSTSNAIG